MKKNYVSHGLVLVLGIAIGVSAMTVFNERVETGDADIAPALSEGNTGSAMLEERALQNRLSILAKTVDQQAEPDEADAGRLEQEVGNLKLLNAFQDAEIEELGGKPIEWSADTPPLFRKEQFQRDIAATISQLDLQVEVENINCEEYPCIAFLRAIDGAEGGWSQTARQIPQHLRENQYQAQKVVESTSIFGLGPNSEHGDLFVFSLSPTPGEIDASVFMQRVHLRSQEGFAEYKAALAGQEK